MNTKAKMVLDYLIVTVIAVLGALNFQVFVFPQANGLALLPPG